MPVSLWPFLLFIPQPHLYYLSLSYYSVIYPSIPLTHFFSYSLSLSFLSFYSVFSIWLQRTKRLTRNSGCALPTSHDRYHCQPAAHCSQVSTTRTMHMLIQLNNCSFKVSLCLSYTTWSYYDPQCAHVTHRGVFVPSRGMIASTEDWREASWQLIAFESFLHWRMIGQRG